MTTQAEWYERAKITHGHSLTCSKSPDKMYPSGEAVYAGTPEARDLSIDMECALGAISVNHDTATVGSLPHILEVIAGEAVLEHVAPWATAVRFVKTGSEATHGAYRIAKRETGRSKVLIGDWAYHGWHEWCQEPDFPFTGRYRHGHDFRRDDLSGIAAVFIEPHRWELVDPSWIRLVREECDKHGTLLVFDSMIYGGRMAMGGATEAFGVRPDIECFGKAFGNGTAVAFLVGRGAVERHAGLMSGTYSGDTMGLDAVIETIDAYTTQPVLATLTARGKQLAAGLDALVVGYPDLGMVREGLPVHQRLRFPDEEQGKKFASKMRRRGIIWHHQVINVSADLSEDNIVQVLRSADECCREMYA